MCLRAPVYKYCTKSPKHAVHYNNVDGYRLCGRDKKNAAEAAKCAAERTESKLKFKFDDLTKPCPICKGGSYK